MIQVRYCVYWCHVHAPANALAGLPQLNLTADEKRVFGQLFQQADTDNLGVVTGEVAVKFFERTKLAPSILGEVLMSLRASHL